MHSYALRLDWTGNLGTGTSGYRDYSRNCVVTANGKPELAGSSDRTFHGDASRWNPEDLLVAALAQCHLLAYLHLVADAGVIVTAYVDEATGEMQTHRDGSGEFTSVVLHPVVTVASAEQTELAQSLHERAHELCFIARSVNFPVSCEPQVRTA